MFAAYTFSSRGAIAGHVAFASAALAFPLLYSRTSTSEMTAMTLLGAVLLVLIAFVVTLLREALERRQQELEDLAVRDPLTGAGNYRLLFDRLEYELARHRRSGEELTVMLLDLDGFKQVNDTQGHLVGDRVLREVAHTLATTLRAQDTLARQGGDEFSILAPETGAEQARQLAARVQHAVVALPSASLTVSVGSATYPTHADAGSAARARRR